MAKTLLSLQKLPKSFKILLKLQNFGKFGHTSKGRLQSNFYTAQICKKTCQLMCKNFHRPAETKKQNNRNEKCKFWTKIEENVKFGRKLRK